MRVDIFTLFPETFQGPFHTSIIKRAVEGGLIDIAIHNIRDYTHDKHHVTDDYPYGGGAGMVLKAEPIFEAVETAAPPDNDTPVILMSPQGRPFAQNIAEDLARKPQIVIICGHYEGVDERVRQHLVTDEISIGDYVLSGGEVAAMVVVEAVARLVPGVLGSEDSAREDSHSEGLLEYPHYTRPSEYRGWEVPAVLLSGNHAQIEAWRREQAIRRTLERRPDLLKKACLSAEEKALIERLRQEPPAQA